MGRTLLIILVVLVAAGTIAVAWMLLGPKPQASPQIVATTHPGTTDMTITSPAFSGDQPIPSEYTCDGAGTSPPLSFADIPTSTKSLALIMHDPDAPSGDWVHWTMWDIPPETRAIAEGTVPPGVIQGVTSSGTSGYGGPCPPNGQHRYVFELYALDEQVGLPWSVDRKGLEAAMEGHIIDQAVLVGTYSRTRT